MEREIEVKLLEVDLEKLEKDLVDKGAKFLGEEHQVNYIINSTFHPISTPGYLRLRKTVKNDEESLEFTFKKQSIQDETRDSNEYTTHIDNAENLLKIMELLDYDQIERGEKLRRCFEYNGARFDLDRWDDNTYPIPYAEIEGESAEAIYELVEEFGLSKEQVTTKSINDLKKEYFNNKNK